MLAFTGSVLVELSLGGTQKIPFTCAYLPGRTRVHVTLYVIGVLLVPLTVMAAQYERDALTEPKQIGVMFVALLEDWLLLRARTAWMTAPGAEPAFDEDADSIVSLGVSDTRHEPDESVPAASGPSD